MARIDEMLGMRTMDDALNSLLDTGVIAQGQALRVASDISRLHKVPVGSASGTLLVSPIRARTKS
jgi:hypothetical protein